LATEAAPAGHLPTHHTALVNGVRLHYVTAGQGEPVVLLHGWLQTWREWRRVLPALAARFTVIVPDLRGFGDSDKPLAGYDARTVAEDVRQLVSRLGHHRVCLVGHDMGALAAYAYAAEHRGDVRRLAWMEEPVPGFGLEEAFAANWSHGVMWWFAFNLVPDLPEALIAGRERDFLSHFYRRYSYDPTAVCEEDVAEYVRCYAAPGAWRGGLGCYRALAQTTEQFRKYAGTPLTIPVLALGGEQSLGALVEQMLRPLAGNLRGVVLERCGHFVPDERPDLLAEHLLTFLERDA
jgi:pimeloyl-ACP methyl ester carboxylesterase